MIAELMDGKLLVNAQGDLNKRKLLNVVEEMAIASGTPVPPVYLIVDPAINAFAAGYSPGDAVIGVTYGAIENLTRDQLQGVIAHEFSHILNGDMRLNIRLMGVLYGILMLALVGRTILRGVGVGVGGRDRSRNTILVIGAGLMMVGYLGQFFGNLIKAAVSRQREFSGGCFRRSIYPQPGRHCRCPETHWRLQSRLGPATPRKCRNQPHFFFRGCQTFLFHHSWQRTHPCPRE